MLRHSPAAVPAVVLLSTVVLPLTITGSSAALPDIASSLSAGPGATRWVVAGHNAAFLMVTGSLADVLGRRLGMETVAQAAVGAVLTTLGGGALVGPGGLRVVGALLARFAVVAAGTVGWTWHNGGTNTGFGSPLSGDPTTT